MEISKRDKLIQVKIEHPALSLKIISANWKKWYPNETINYGYARQVWAEYKKNLLTKKGTPLTPFPFMVQNFGYFCHGPTRWYHECPLKASSNRNMQKHLRQSYFAVTFHKNGTIFVYDYHVKWKDELKSWLDSWMHEDEIPLFFDNLNMKDRKHFGVSAPGIPTNFSFKVTGIGKFTADKTPYPKGTMEYEIDPGFVKRLDRIEDNQTQFSENMVVFAEGMKNHMKLIGQFQNVSEAQQSTSEALKKGLDTLNKAMEGILEAVKELKKEKY